MVNPILNQIIQTGGYTQTGLAEELTAYFARHGVECRVTQKHVWNWLNRPAGVPINMAYPLEVVTGSPGLAHRLYPANFPEAA